MTIGAAILSCIASPGAELRAPLYQDGFHCTLDAETNAIYVLEKSTNLTEWAEVGRDYSLETNRPLIFAGDSPQAFFRVRRTNEALFQYAIALTESLDLNGNSFYADSFDSGNTYYSTRGRYDNNKALDRAGIAASGGITNSVPGFGNAHIYGKLATRAESPVQIGTNGSIGDRAFVSTHSGLQPGAVTNEINMRFPSVVPPFKAGLPMGGRYTWTNGVTYDAVMGSGAYLTSTLTNKILVLGHARLLVTSSFTMTGQSVIQIAPGASLTLFMDGASASFGGKGVQNNGSATSFIYFGTPRNTQLQLSGNGEFTGVIYAPSAAIVGNGGGNSSEDFSGALIAKSWKFNGHYSFHYDEALQRSGFAR